MLKVVQIYCLRSSGKKHEKGDSSTGSRSRTRAQRYENDVTIIGHSTTRQFCALHQENKIYRIHREGPISRHFLGLQNLRVGPASLGIATGQIGANWDGYWDIRTRKSLRTRIHPNNRTDWDQLSHNRTFRVFPEPNGYLQKETTWGWILILIWNLLPD